MSSYNMFLEFLNPGIGDIISSSDDDVSFPQPHQGTEHESLTEGFDNLDNHLPNFNYGGILFDSSFGFTLPPSNVQSWQSPKMMVPANSTTREMPFPDSCQNVDASVANPYGMFDARIIANPGACLYSPSQGIAPIGTLLTDQSDSLAHLGTSSPSTSFSSPSEISMAEDNVFSDLEHQDDDISSPSPSATSCSPSSSISDARRFASTRASHSDGAYTLPTEIASTVFPPVKFSSKAPRGDKRKIDVSEQEDLSLCYHDEEDGDAESSDEDEYHPESGDDSDLDARGRNSFASSKQPSPKVYTSDDIQPVANANRRKNRSGSKPRGPAAKKAFLNDGHTNAVGGFVCGLITQWKGKGGQYTSKGIRTPEVGEVCQMRTRNWSDMIRHQEKTFWHSPPGVCQSCQSSLNGRQDNLHRHGLAACKGPMKGKKASSKRPSKKARK